MPPVTPLTGVAMVAAALAAGAVVLGAAIAAAVLSPAGNEDKESTSENTEEK
jgi:hypothetical protein